MAGIPRRELRKRGFITHLAVYILVIFGLAGINYTFSPGFPWFIFPAVGWGIGVLMHFLFGVLWPAER